MKKTDKKIGWIIFLLFLLYASSSGNYLNSGDDYLYDNSSWLALIDLVIVSVAMMIVPFIWRLINKELLPFKKGKRICMWNSIILFIVSIILSATSGISIIGGIGAVIYYFINKWFFVDYMNIGVSVNYIICNNCESKVDSRKKICPNCELPLEGKELKENTGKFKCSSCGALYDSDDKYCKNCNGIFEDDEEEIESDNYVDEATSNNEKKFICDNCGALVSENEIECPNCGEEFEEEVVDLEKLLETANKNKNKGNYSTAEEQYKEYCVKTEKLIKNGEFKGYTFNNCVEFSIAVNQNEVEEDCVDLNYETNNAYLNLAIIAFDKKDNDEAIKYLNKAIKLNPCDVNAMFELAENYKVKKELIKYYNLTKKIYSKIYDINNLARYYRNLGYYYIEKEEWDLAKAVYLYSLKYQDSSVVTQEIAYIVQKSKNDKLPDKEDLRKILKENNIPIFISKENMNVIKELKSQLEKEDKLSSNVGKFIENLYKLNSNM